MNQLRAVLVAVGPARRHPHGTDQHGSGLRNICRCGTYHRIREAILSAQTKF